MYTAEERDGQTLLLRDGRYVMSFTGSLEETKEQVELFNKLPPKFQLICELEWFRKETTRDEEETRMMWMKIFLKSPFQGLEMEIFPDLISAKIFFKVPEIMLPLMKGKHDTLPLGYGYYQGRLSFTPTGWDVKKSLSDFFKLFSPKSLRICEQVIPGNEGILMLVEPALPALRTLRVEDRVIYLSKADKQDELMDYLNYFWNSLEDQKVSWAACSLMERLLAIQEHLSLDILVYLVVMQKEIAGPAATQLKHLESLIKETIQKRAPERAEKILKGFKRYPFPK